MILSQDAPGTISFRTISGKRCKYGLFTVPSQQHWLKSPASGVVRIPLERESGHATSFVCYQAGAFFPEHRHIQGKEIYVIDGVFSDENGDYPAGSWIRNPHLSQHHPYVKEETLILVKVGHLKPA